MLNMLNIKQFSNITECEFEHAEPFTKFALETKHWLNIGSNYTTVGQRWADTRLAISVYCGYRSSVSLLDMLELSNIVHTRDMSYQELYIESSWSYTVVVAHYSYGFTSRGNKRYQQSGTLFKPKLRFTDIVMREKGIPFIYFQWNKLQCDPDF